MNFPFAKGNLSFKIWKCGAVRLDEMKENITQPQYKFGGDNFSGIQEVTFGENEVSGEVRVLSSKSGSGVDKEKKPVFPMWYEMKSCLFYISEGYAILSGHAEAVIEACSLLSVYTEKGIGKQTINEFENAVLFSASDKLHPVRQVMVKNPKGSDIEKVKLVGRDLENFLGLQNVISATPKIDSLQGNADWVEMDGKKKLFTLSIGKKGTFKIKGTKIPLIPIKIVKELLNVVDVFPKKASDEEMFQ